MTLEDIDLAADPLQPFGDCEAIGARFEDEQILAPGMARGPRAQAFQRLAGNALRDARLERIASVEDRGGEGIRMDVEADGAAARAECRGWIGGLLWWCGLVHVLGSDDQQKARPHCGEPFSSRHPESASSARRRSFRLRASVGPLHESSSDGPVSENGE